jgi:ATP-dependent Lon protease
MNDELPAEIPVMTLPATVLFPRTVLPLHIFEPRYREMLDDVLAAVRIFAVARMARPSLHALSPTEPPHRVATAGIIRACQKNADGTSDLLLEGLQRVRIRSIIRESPYRVIAVDPLPDATDASSAELGRLRRDLLRALEVRRKLGASLPPEIERAVRGIADPAALCDLLVFAMSGDPNFQQSMLETIDPARRLARAIDRFRQEATAQRLQRRLQGSLDDDSIGHN